ncbi:methyltransferase domain-containing protein [Candidatus Haliotispira prima]|uniref:Methyltransferase domain-containing protein n=1 Tax=Candidatus Haliotispira prima TaxID=3034016 RepID=A0ABY8MFC6_9SPIO|nr:methyltransferase domain-containing protein [Candidatus Haliotispira prima]
MKDLIARHFSRAARSYDAVTPVQQQSAEVLFALLEDFVPHAARPTLLDVGVGRGRLFRLACEQRRRAGKQNWQLHGIDFAPQMLAEVEKLWPESVLHCVDAEAYDYKADSFDLIVSNFALQWCEAPVSLLLCLYAALRRGGRLAVSFPLHGSFRSLARRLRECSGEELPIYPLPKKENMTCLREQLPGVALTERDFVVEYSSAYAALLAIKRAGAQTVASDAPRLSYAALRALQKDSEPLVLDYRVLFVSVQKA